MSSFISDVKALCGIGKQNVPQGGGIAAKPQSFNIAGRQIQEDKLLSEGAFGYIWKAHDVNTGEIFALKRMMCRDNERMKVAQMEMKIFQQLPIQQNIVRFYGAEVLNYQGGRMVVFLLEYCDEGSLFELMEKRQHSRLQENEILNLTRQIALGIQSLHNLNPPMQHRDIKIENVLIKQNKFKLCDFGSSSSQVVDFSQVPKSQYVDYEEVFEKNTTPMYRPPEICDPYLGYKVNEKVDVWMLGCVIFTLCFYIHPFIDGQKVGISQARYRIPRDSQYSEKLHDLIRHMLTPNPLYRPSIHDIVNIMNSWNSFSQIPLNQQAQQLKQQMLQEMKEEDKFNQNKKPIKSFNGEIPMDELLKMQNKIMQENNKEETFAEIKRKREQEKLRLAQQQKQRYKQQLQQAQGNNSTQQWSSNNQKNQNQSNNKQWNSNNNWDPFGNNNNSANTQNKQQNQNNNTSQWDAGWSDFSNNNQSNQNQNNSQNNTDWDNLQNNWAQQSTQNTNNNNFNQQNQNNINQQSSNANNYNLNNNDINWDSSQNQWNNINNNSNNNNNNFNNNKQEQNLWDLVNQPNNQVQNQNQNSNQNNNNFQNTQQQQQQQQQEEDLLGIDNNSNTQNNQQQDFDIADLQF
ncbi:Protein kinase-like domain [Pseudocohnilembus persalinus]|uniref:non-specific serine/threonine protein kinase n=1 Tax=Pseudocohnilembus persalinus TaxID=266149 RepID=A0A0V0Q8L6_PSEPJ|nr:Protein kinase-like domain [Pseudocohnilembus persalinus]|eukprot:KRW98372.1 Protein kinase-like domain [Pseudocohnilembus persalinus]